MNLSQGSVSSTSLSAPKVPPLPNSPSLAQTIGMDESSGIMANGDDVLTSYHLPRPLPLWLNPAYAKHIVKGNFTTLSARPMTVEQGEWIAHQGMGDFPLTHWTIDANLDGIKWLSIIEICGTSFELFTKRRKIELPSATRRPVPECLLERKSAPLGMNPLPGKSHAQVQEPLLHVAQQPS